jgi:hypothetical protein
MYFIGTSCVFRLSSPLHSLNEYQSTLPRFISFPVIDLQCVVCSKLTQALLIILFRPTSGLGLNLSEIRQLGKLWGSPTMIQVYNSLIEPTNDANAGKLIGNRNFYNNDYMVSRCRQPEI